MRLPFSISDILSSNKRVSAFRPAKSLFVFLERERVRKSDREREKKTPVSLVICKRNS